jgi:hypothetical protein
MIANAFYSDSLAPAVVEDSSANAEEGENRFPSLWLAGKFKMGQCSISARIRTFKGLVDDRVADEDSNRVPGAVPTLCR